MNICKRLSTLEFKEICLHSNQLFDFAMLSSKRKQQMFTKNTANSVRLKKTKGIPSMLHATTYFVLVGTWNKLIQKRSSAQRESHLETSLSMLLDGEFNVSVPNRSESPARESLRAFSSISSTASSNSSSSSSTNSSSLGVRQCGISAKIGAISKTFPDVLL